MHRNSLDARGAFTLIELLVVIAIIAILAVVVVLTLNPAQILEQSRDANRLSDLSTINNAVGLYAEDNGGSLGSPTDIYLSVPDPSATSTAGDQCQGLGLTGTPTNYAYQCAGATFYRNVDANGWIPINFKSLSSGSPLGNLPVDPVNQTSSNLFYNYVASGTQYEISGALESQKYRGQLLVDPPLPNYPEVAAEGNAPGIAGLWNSVGLLAYWPFDNLSGSTVQDFTGDGYTGTLVNSPALTTGKFSDALQFNGSNYVSTSLSWPASGTISMWVDPTSYTAGSSPAGWKYSPITGGYILIDTGTSGSPGVWRFVVNPSGSSEVVLTGSAIVQNQWTNVVATWYTNGRKVISYLYVDGQMGTTAPWSGTVSPYIGTFAIGTAGQSATNNFTGLVDDVRVYNRPLSQVEVQELYTAQE